MSLTDAGPYARAQARARLQLEADLAGKALDRARATLRDATIRVKEAQAAVTQAQDAFTEAQDTVNAVPHPERSVTEIRDWVAARIGMYEDNIVHMQTPTGQAGFIEAAKTLGRVLAFIDGEDV
jgi:hypothetical protein